MSDIHAFMAQDLFARHVGIELVEASEGRATARLTLDGRHLNGAGTVHGAALFALADVAFAAASNSHGPLAMGVNATVAYLKAVREGTLVAVAEEISLGRRLATYTVRITDDAGEPVALFQGTVYRRA